MNWWVVCGLSVDFILIAVPAIALAAKIIIGV